MRSKSQFSRSRGGGTRCRITKVLRLMALVVLLLAICLVAMVFMLPQKPPKHVEEIAHVEATKKAEAMTSIVTDPPTIKPTVPPVRMEPGEMWEAPPIDPSRPFGAYVPTCLREGKLLDYPMTPLEVEARRVFLLIGRTLTSMGVVHWPADGTLLGITREGRISTDRIVDFHIVTTMFACEPLLRSIGERLGQEAEIRDFRVGTTHPTRGIGMLATMEFGGSNGSPTVGGELMCVYNSTDRVYRMYNHYDQLVNLPPSLFPLSKCRVYDVDVPCPGNAVQLLNVFHQRYTGCLVFPHCFGNPATSISSCPTPHVPTPLDDIVLATATLQNCGYQSLVSQMEKEPTCSTIRAAAQLNCITEDENEFCFTQEFRH